MLLQNRQQHGTTPAIYELQDQSTTSLTGRERMRVTKLEGALLDFWVAKSENLTMHPETPESGETPMSGDGFWHPDSYHPSRNWAHGGSIVAEEWYGIEDALLEWFGTGWPFIKAITDDPLKWFMRAYVKTKFGDEVEEMHMNLPPALSPEIKAATVRRTPWSSWLGGGN